MKIYLTADASVALWVFNCIPGSHYKRENWYRPEDVAGENELGQLHRFCDKMLCKVVTKKVVVKDEKGNDKEEEQQDRLFASGEFSLKPALISRARQQLEHYRKLKEGILLPIHFADLDMALQGKKPDDDFSDPNDTK